MPLVIKNINWRETSKTVILKVPWNGVHSDVDILYTSSYLKASYGNYFFEAFLFQAIDTQQSSCVLSKPFIVFELIKSKEEFWYQLEKVFYSKSEKLAVKKQCLEEIERKLQAETKATNDRRCELKRTAVSEQLCVDSEHRKQIEMNKKEEKEKALNDIFQNKNDSHDSNSLINHVSKISSKSIEIPLRSNQSVNISFTPREFPTPSRESRLNEENEWLRRQAMARRSAGFHSEDLRTEEKNPQFLKEKGDQFMKSNNYLAAISAYTFGIKISGKFVDLYIARSAAHMAIQNFNRAIQDCSTALELLKPELPINLKERAICIGRRGIGLIKLGLISHGIEELQSSLKLMPNIEFQSELDQAIKNRMID